VAAAVAILITQRVRQADLHRVVEAEADLVEAQPPMVESEARELLSLDIKKAPKGAFYLVL